MLPAPIATEPDVYGTLANSGPLQTLIRGYLIHGADGRLERPQFLYMRVALAIHKHNIPRVLETYNALSEQLYTHASPTLFNAATTTPNYASCFIAQPFAHSPQTLLRSASDLDTYWMSDGGVGISLADVPCRRLTGSVVLFPIMLTCLLVLQNRADSSAWCYGTNAGVRQSRQLQHPQSWPSPVGCDGLPADLACRNPGIHFLPN